LRDFDIGDSEKLIKLFKCFIQSDNNGNKMIEVSSRDTAKRFFEKNDFHATRLQGVVHKVVAV
jgi:hypothetical protein